ncbi:response regulator transcription factor [Rhodovulum sp. DZ06]|uniref:helix-turn-helix transcriptional regulator n=1 Tax=Rhodovulum sp. DZ06 TaxID=3425126 RepID=UPI003D34AE92
MIYTAGRRGQAMGGPAAMAQMGRLCRGAALSLRTILAADAGGDAGPGAAGGPGAAAGADPARPPLPPQLLRVAILLCEGMSNKGIARETGLSEHTVKEYVQTLIRRYEVENRTALAARLVRDGAAAPAR